ncbi:heat shock protein DnaJ domain-containing protein [Pseudonocardia dioxanivorans CB1190]|uniref:Heat shock protein DnaJ domain-containing protein n=1 Tax=Pseudonocardia dioxanivorans (strain ATCC 55486 / DSM 44775 / JCM 13855 / CB1190) TaxID=675635 RepID=F4CNK2_PSEUX|nr:hypothetical protein [Pseudonocardia dioxanivorans]AEA28300.1 heat shock protein DnaJ domain-containing protein [Pseudonocardia dioxanivorans CB1190]
MAARTTGTIRDAADAAYRRAAEAFLACDDAEQHARRAADALVALDPRQAAAIRADVDTACRAALGAVVDWISAVDAHQSTIRSPDAVQPALAAAARDFTAAREALERATPAAQRYADRHREALTRAAAATEVRDRAARSAVAVVDEAVAAVDRARAAGLSTPKLDAAVAAVRARVASAADAGIGQASLAAWADTEAAARELLDQAQQAERRRTELPNRIRSLTTRAAGIEGRAQSLPTTLSTLRRNYSLACSAGLERAGDDVAAAVTTARRALAAADAAAVDDDWARALREVDAARAALDTADRLVTAVGERLRTLDEVRSDPAARLAKARFTLRDAQQLVVANRARAAAEIPVLDALAERLDRAPGLLGATHPDYWSYLQELDAVTRAAQDTVSRVRQRLATGR